MNIFQNATNFIFALLHSTGSGTEGTVPPLPPFPNVGSSVTVGVIPSIPYGTVKKYATDTPRSRTARIRRGIAFGNRETVNHRHSSVTSPQRI